MLCREIEDNGYHKCFTSVNLQWKESEQVGAVLTPYGSLPRAAGEAQLFAMRDSANIPSWSGLAMGRAVMGGYCLHLSTGVCNTENNSEELNTA